MGHRANFDIVMKSAGFFHGNGPLVVGPLEVFEKFRVVGGGGGWWWSSDNRVSKVQVLSPKSFQVLTLDLTFGLDFGLDFGLGLGLSLDNKARTSRYQRSTIPYLQKLLNADRKEKEKLFA